MQENSAAKLPRSRGGKGEDFGKSIANIAITAAATNPGFEIALHHVIPNLANGDCSFESVTDQLNNSRNSATNSDFSTCGTGRFEDPQALRLAVANDLKVNHLAMEKFGKLDDFEGYQREVDKLQVPGVWNVKAGDLVLPGIAFTTRKNILVYNTNPRNGFSPISVVSPSQLGGTTDSNIPIVLCYSGSHYEGLVPNTEEDVVKTIRLVEAYIGGGYNVRVQDIPILNEQLLAVQQKRARRSASKRPSSPGQVQPLPNLKQQRARTSSPPLKMQHLSHDHKYCQQPKRKAQPPRKCKVVQIQPTPPISTSNMFEGLAQNVTESCKVCKLEVQSLMRHLRFKPACSSHYDVAALREETTKRKKLLIQEKRRAAERAENPEGVKAENRKHKENSRAKKNATNPEGVKANNRKYKQDSRANKKLTNPEGSKADNQAAKLRMENLRAKKNATNPEGVKEQNNKDKKNSRAKKNATNPEGVKAQNRLDQQNFRASQVETAAD